MLIDRVRKALQVVLNKDEVGGYLRPSTFAYICNDVQLELLNDLRFGKNKSQKGPSILTLEGEGSNTLAIDEVARFYKQASLGAPEFTLPDDYMSHVDLEAFWAEGFQQVQVDVVSVDELKRRVHSDIAKPTYRRPVAARTASGSDLRPQNMILTLVYIAKPNIPYWNYSTATGELVFVETGGNGNNPNAGVAAGDSTDFVFSDMVLPELVLRIASKMGVSLREQDVFQMVKTEERV